MTVVDTDTRQQRMMDKVAAMQAIVHGGTTDLTWSPATLQALVWPLAVPAMGGRVHARGGRLQNAVAGIRAVGPQLADLVDQGTLDPLQAACLSALDLGLEMLIKRPEGAFPPDAELAKGFEFLWSDVFEDDGWRLVRRCARAAYTALRAPDDRWLG